MNYYDRLLEMQVSLETHIARKSLAITKIAKRARKTQSGKLSARDISNQIRLQKEIKTIEHMLAGVLKALDEEFISLIQEVVE